MPNEFWQTIDKEFSAAVSPPVVSEGASPHECCEAIRQLFGPDVVLAQFAETTEVELRRLADALGAWLRFCRQQLRGYELPLLGP